MNLQGLELLLEGITKYLDFTGQFKRLSMTLCNVSREFRTEQEWPTFYFSVKIDFLILVNIAGRVADLVIMEPNVAYHLFNKVINIAVKLEDTALCIKKGEVQSSLNITLPLIPSILFLPGKCYLPSSGLFVIKGIIIALTMTTKYCKSAVYRCPLVGCPGHKGQRVFGDLMTINFCKTCGSATKEILRARVDGEQVLAVFIKQKSFCHNFQRYQGITVCLRDDLIKDLSLGMSFNVVVSRKQSFFHAWGIEPTISEHLWRAENNLAPVSIPSKIKLLQDCVQKACPNSPWAFTATLASQLASQLYPCNSFLHLKTGLLLSLASQDTEKVPVPLLAVGPDCYSLLQAASELSFRKVTVTSPTLCGSINGSVNTLWMEASPLQLATGGVCYVGDWAKFGTGRTCLASHIITALETDKVEQTTINNSVLGSPPSQPLRSAIWSFWSGDKATPSAQTQLRTLIEVFGMPFIGDGSADIEAIVEHLLLEAMQSSKVQSFDPVLSKEDIKQYLNIVCSLKVNLTTEASRLLRNYFVASRRERPDFLPLKAIKIMTALAEAHARLCLRTNVIYEDVILVVFLYEESIRALFGHSLMSPPPMLFGGLIVDSKHPSIGEQVHYRLKDFSLWLEQYIKDMLSESSINCSVDCSGN